MIGRGPCEITLNAENSELLIDINMSCASGVYQNTTAPEPGLDAELLLSIADSIVEQENSEVEQSGNSLWLILSCRQIATRMCRSHPI